MRNGGAGAGAARGPPRGVRGCGWARGGDKGWHRTCPLSSCFAFLQLPPQICRSWARPSSPSSSSPAQGFVPSLGTRWRVRVMPVPPAASAQPGTPSTPTVPGPPLGPPALRALPLSLPRDREGGQCHIPRAVSPPSGGSEGRRGWHCPLCPAGGPRATPVASQFAQCRAELGPGWGSPCSRRCPHGCSVPIVPWVPSATRCPPSGRACGLGGHCQGDTGGQGPRAGGRRCSCSGSTQRWHPALGTPRGGTRPWGHLTGFKGQSPEPEAPWGVGDTSPGSGSCH